MSGEFHPGRASRHCYNQTVLLAVVFLTWMLLTLFFPHKPTGPNVAKVEPMLPAYHHVELWPTARSLPHDRPISEELRLLLYPEEPVRSQVNLSAYRPSMTAYLIPHTRAPAVLVFPGGGYGVLSDREGPAMCQFLFDNGFHAVLVNYRVQRRHPAPLADARRAIQLVRFHSERWGVDISSVGVIGFSAGGHLAGHVGVAWDTVLGREVDSKMNDEIARLSARPDFVALAYPVVSADSKAAGLLPAKGKLVPPHGLLPCVKYSCVGDSKPGGERPTRHHGSIEVLLGEQRDKPHAQAQVSLDSLVDNRDHAASEGQELPPFFIWHGADDVVVPSINSIMLAGALRRAGVPTEFHLFERAGPHGLGLASPADIAIALAKDPHAVVNPNARNWTQLLLRWLGAHGNA
jgi:acetyl esterase/lipase